MPGTTQYLVAVFGILTLVGISHRWVGEYPDPLESDRGPRRELTEVAVLFGLAVLLVGYASLAYRGLVPTMAFRDLGGRAINPIVVLLGPLVFVAAPAILELDRHDRSIGDIGVRLPMDPLSAVALVGVGIGIGISALRVGAAEPVSGLALLFSLYNPAIEEEFLFRGVLQSKLERAVGTTRAWLGSGLLFGLVHIPNDFVGAIWIAHGGDPVIATLQLAQQTAYGLLAGVLYAKCRSLLPAVLAHYFANDLGELLVTAGAWLGLT